MNLKEGINRKDLKTINMHWKTKQRLRTAAKLYTIEPEIDKAYEIKMQLPTMEYVCIYLNEPFSQKVQYRSLSNGGFNYDPLKDTPITHNPKNEVIRILKNSVGFRSNNANTIEKLIELIKPMDI